MSNAWRCSRYTAALMMLTLAPVAARAQVARSAMDTTFVRLDDLVSTALLQNLRLQSVSAETRGIASSTLFARSPFDPVVGLSVSGNERTYGARVSGVLPTGADYASTISRATLPGQLFQQRAVAATVNQPLLRGLGVSSLRNTIRATDEAAAAAAAGLAQARVSVVATVGLLYAQLLEANQQEAVALRSRGRADELAVAYVELRRLDKITEVDLITAQLGVTSRSALLLNARRARQAAQDQLVAAVYGASAAARFPPDAVVLIPSDSVAPPDIGLSLDSAVARAIAARQDVEAARRQLAQARLLEGSARNALLPALDLSAVVTRTQLDGDDPLTGRSSPLTISPLKASVGLVFSRPLRNAASNASRERAAATTENARALLSDAENLVRLEVRAAYRDIEIGRELVRLAAESSVLARRQFQGERARLDLGLTDIFRVLQFDEQVASVEQSEASARAALAASYVRLQAALGGDTRGARVSGAR